MTGLSATLELTGGQLHKACYFELCDGGRSDPSVAFVKLVVLVVLMYSVFDGSG